METLQVGPLCFAETPFLEIDAAEWTALVDALERATFEIQTFACACPGAGRIVTVSAAAAARAIPGCTLDGVAGAFLTTVTQVAAAELEPRAITANVVVPARPPDTDTLAAVAAFLGSEAAAGVTGAVVAADGGFSITKEAGGKPPLPEPG
jgi:enoyl-[acyl-carrier-protein] reductase (NADH)